MTQRKNIDIGPVITMTRNAYRLVKIAPFIYAMIYIMCLFGYLMFNDTVSAMIDVLCYISPVPVIYNLLLSKAFHLCIWHRTECCLPLVAVLVVGVDSFIISLADVSAFVYWCVALFCFGISLFNAYHIFINPKCINPLYGHEHQEGNT